MNRQDSSLLKINTETFADIRLLRMFSIFCAVNETELLLKKKQKNKKQLLGMITFATFLDVWVV